MPRFERLARQPVSEIQSDCGARQLDLGETDPTFEAAVGRAWSKPQNLSKLVERHWIALLVEEAVVCGEGDIMMSTSRRDCPSAYGKRVSGERCVSDGPAGRTEGRFEGTDRVNVCMAATFRTQESNPARSSEHESKHRMILP
jgi:hypothetical protein